MSEGTDINSNITLKGSSSLIISFFECCLNSILFLRGLYSEADFKPTTKYGVKVYLSDNPDLSEYTNRMMSQLKIWLEENIVSKFVIVISSADTLEVVERWQFDIETNGENGLPMVENVPPADAEKIRKRSTVQIQTVLRQILHSVSYLPSLEDDEYTFKILAYTERDIQVPEAWEDCGPSMIEGGGEHVRLKPVFTLVHSIEPFVAYKLRKPF
ncbi:DNA-binding HORMA domain-containing protein [Pilaira anomala]|nr:DNA-binding HORMA domain-containing protein [Pilaira anomala]